MEPPAYDSKGRNTRDVLRFLHGGEPRETSEEIRASFRESEEDHPGMRDLLGKITARLEGNGAEIMHRVIAYPGHGLPARVSVHWAEPGGVTIWASFEEPDGKVVYERRMTPEEQRS